MPISILNKYQVPQTFVNPCIRGSDKGIKRFYMGIKQLTLIRDLSSVQSNSLMQKRVTPIKNMY